MKTLFSIHVGEVLAGTYIEEHFKNINIWLPSKDTGIDLLLTDKSNKHSISLQVKFSKDFSGSSIKNSPSEISLNVKSQGWFKFAKAKLNKSPADYWILVLYTFTKKDFDFVVIKPHELLRRLAAFGKNTEVIQSYIWVTKNNKCWETRGLKKIEEIAIANDNFKQSDRDLTEYLNNWNPIKKDLGHPLA